MSSTSLVYQLHAPTCFNCGKNLRHLYHDHIELTNQLIDELKSGRNIPQKKYIGRISGKNITPFLITYYTWKQEHPNSVDFQPVNLVARGLITLKKLTPEMLPFGMDREEDNQISVLTENRCCLRMFLCNPLLSV